MEVIRQGELHPLQNHHILEHILKQLPTKDLKLCRLVCREWRKIGTKAMRPIARVKITVENTTRGAEPFMELIQRPESQFSASPFSNAFELYGATIGDQFAPFWEHCGRHIKHLNLRCVTFPSVEALRQAIFVSCPNLTKLELCSVRVTGDRSTLNQTSWKEPLYPPNHNVKALYFYGSLYYLMSTVSLVELFVQFPSLEDLNADCHAAHYKMDNIFKSLKSVRNHDKNLCKIKRLRCNFEEIGDPSILVASLDKDIALETLEAKWMRTANCVSAVQRIWAANSKSLKNVFLRGTLTPAVPIPEGNDLTKLEDFALVAWKLESVRFLERTPNVKTLCLHLDELQDTGNMDGIILPNCTELTLSIKNELIEVEVFKRFQKMLPNIEKLRVFRTNNATFALICEFWPKLKTLELKGSDVDDAGICGWDEEDVDIVNRNGENCAWRPVTVPRPNLTNLKGLQNFRYELKNVEGIRLGYCAAAYGVMLLPELRNLHVPNSSGAGAIWDRMRLQMQPRDEFRHLFVDWIE